MLAKRTVPAVMTVDGYMEEPHIEGAVTVLPSAMQLKVRVCEYTLPFAAQLLPLTVSFGCNVHYLECMSCAASIVAVFCGCKILLHQGFVDGGSI